LNEDETRLAATYGVRPSVRAMGCDKCGESGYRGRLPVVEVATVSPSMGELIAGGATVAALNRAALAAGMRGLREVALEREKHGETTLQGVERVVGESGEDEDSTPESGSAPAVAAPSVLVVDDDPVLRAVATKLLRDGGYRAEAVNDGADALKHIAGGAAVHLVVTDLHMPKVNGEALLTALRTAGATAALPVIVLTGDYDQGEEARLMDAGADDYIRKPIDPNRFVARVRAALRRANL
jgi:CheY-like chemotaxis protein